MKLSFFLFALLAVETTTSVFANVFEKTNIRGSRIVGGGVAAKGDYPYFGE